MNAGCAQLHDPNVPEPIRQYLEPVHERDYLLYIPSRYDREHAWPLVVVCHSTFPDTAVRQMRAWTVAAESSEFIVAAPSLEASRGSSMRSAEDQIPLQRADEDYIVALVQHVRGAYNVSDDRIFIHGFARGAASALQAGFRHPEIFRAISLLQPNAKSGYLVDLSHGIDAHQPVYLNYSVDDVLRGKKAAKCVEWLRSHGADLREDPAGPARKNDVAGPVEFFERVIRKDPWIRVHTFAPSAGDPLEIQFRLRCSYQPRRVFWEFGDGETSSSDEPVHRYKEPGTYEVALTIAGAGNREDRRTLSLIVP